MQRKQKKRKKNKFVHVSALPNQFKKALTHICNTYKWVVEGSPTLHTAEKKSSTLINVFRRQQARGRHLRSPQLSRELSRPADIGWSPGCPDVAQYNKPHTWWGGESKLKNSHTHTKPMCCTCFRCFLSSPDSGSGRGGRISAFVGAITCKEV